MTGGSSRADFEARDAADPLAPLRAQFALEHVDAERLIYFDGNSLGALPRAAIARVRQVVEEEWGAGLIRSWNSTASLPRRSTEPARAGWITLSQRVADRIAPLIGAGPGEVVVTDSTSVNLYKVLSAAVAFASADAPSRRRLVSERTNFPTDLYIAESVARAHGFDLTLVEPDEIPASLDGRLAILMLTHVNYRTGRMHPMAPLTRAAHDAGAIVIWDLSHSAGAVPVNLYGDDAGEAADFAVGCGYKYLNGGPGAPAFAWAHPQHIGRMDRDGWHQPLSGWLGHAAPFDFTPDYRPAAGIARFVCGTPPVISLAALECGVDSVRAADAYGGMPALRQKSVALSQSFIDLVEARCAGHDLILASPRDPEQRGSQIGFAHAAGGYAIMQALIARGVIGDFRAPDILRFGFTPLYTRFVDVWDAVDRLNEVLTSGEWREPRFAVRGAVT
jgi:kynureninase